MRCSHTFQQRLSSGTNYISYPNDYNIGNDENSSVLKFPIKLLECGIDVNDALYTLYKQLERVAQTGGCVIAHNVRHDMAQLCKTAEMIGYTWPASLQLRTFDTVKTASNFVPGTEEKWMKLCDIARICNIKPSGELHDAEVDVDLLWRIVSAFFPYDDRMYAYTETFMINK